jgi:hypothetical protein
MILIDPMGGVAFQKLHHLFNRQIRWKIYQGMSVVRIKIVDQDSCTRLKPCENERGRWSALQERLPAEPSHCPRVVCNAVIQLARKKFDFLRSQFVISAPTGQHTPNGDRQGYPSYRLRHHELFVVIEALENVGDIVDRFEAAAETKLYHFIA